LEKLPKHQPEFQGAFEIAIDLNAVSQERLFQVEPAAHDLAECVAIEAE
jgi:hypothetical protein